MNQEETTEQGKGWRWAAIILVGLMVLLITCMLSAIWGGLLGYALGRGTSASRHVQVPDYDYWGPGMPPVPEMPPMPELPWQYEQGAWLGVTFRMTPEGALISAVVSGSPAESAGIRPGDVITEVDGQAVTEARPLDEHIRRYQPGDRVEIALQRDGRERVVTVRLGARMQGELPWQQDNAPFEFPLQPGRQG